MTVGQWRRRDLGLNAERALLPDQRAEGAVGLLLAVDGLAFQLLGAHQRELRAIDIDLGDGAGFLA